MANDPNKPKPIEIDLDADVPEFDINNMDELEDLFAEELKPICLHENVVHRVFTTFEFWQCVDCREEVPEPKKPVGFDFDMF